MAISAVTEAELRYGLERKPESVRLRTAAERFLHTITVLPWTSEVAKTYGKVRSGLQTAGKTLALMDLFIASHAVSMGAILVSHDLAFRSAEHWMTWVDWAADL